MKKTTLKGFMFLLCILLMANMSAFASYTGSGTFTKINSLSALTDGLYVIAYGDQAMSVVENNANRNLRTGTVAINDGISITDPDVQVVWEIKREDGTCTIYNEAYGYASSGATSSNHLMPSAEVKDVSVWNVSGSAAFRFMNNKNTDYYLGHNPVNTPKLFAQYKLSSSTMKLDLDLYRYEEVVTCTASGLSFDQPSVIKTADADAFTLTATTLNLSTPVVYSSSNTNVAAVDPATGEVTVKGTGTTTIQASQDAGTYQDIDYCVASTSYKLTVRSSAEDLVILCALYHDAWYALPASDTDGRPEAVPVTVTDGKVYNPAEHLIWKKELHDTEEYMAFRSEYGYLGYSGSGTELTFADNVPYYWELTNSGLLVSTETDTRAIAFRKTNITPPMVFGGYAVSNSGNADYVFTIQLLKSTSTLSGQQDVQENLIISTQHDKIRFTAASGEEVLVYALSGQQVVRLFAAEGENVISLSVKGAFVIKVGNRIAKVVL